MRQRVFTGSPMEKTAGYSRAIACGAFAHVAGTTGYDYETMQMPVSVTEQTQNTIETIQRALEELGFTLNDVVRATYYATSRDYVDNIFAVVGSVFVDVRPAATLIVCDLADPAMKVEIEVTAQKR
ncbi:RidA family protein [Rhodobacteraceae bacterium D3-12]|nr:RidA family protein [Rhodobacteraceae bacterium D3-12]